MKRIVFFLFSIFLACNTNLHAQENKDIDKYKEFLDYAHQSFNSGDYDKAKTHLTAYKRFTSDSASVHNFEQQIELCIEIKNNAQEAERKGDYSKALGYYLSLQRNNPEDPNVASWISICKDKINPSEKPNVQAVEETNVRTVKKSFRPDSNFNMRILSDFTNKGVFGLGFHGNKSFFQVGFDFVIAKTFSYKNRMDDWSSYHYDENMTKLNANYDIIGQVEYKTNNGKFIRGEYDYIRPVIQLVCSPGVNLKYISLECGLGVLINQRISIAKQLNSNLEVYSYEVTEGPKSQTNYLIRPTFVGYVPMGRYKNGGMSISIGYNIVNKLDIYNGIMFGVGFFVKK